MRPALATLLDGAQTGLPVPPRVAHRGSGLQTRVRVQDYGRGAMARRDSDVNLSRLAEHTSYDVDEGVPKTLPLPTHRLLRERQLGQPGLEVVGQAGAGRKGRVGEQAPVGMRIPATPCWSCPMTFAWSQRW